MDDIVTGEESTCVYCGQRIGAVIDPISGMFDWGSFMPPSFNIPHPSDFGCDGSPETDEDGCGSHNPGPNHTPVGFMIPGFRQAILVPHTSNATAAINDPSRNGQRADFERQQLER